jgi:hypothetical protein
VIPNELDVDWTHDRLRVVLPVWRDRSQLWIAVLLAWSFVVVFLGGWYIFGAVACVWMLPEFRKVVLEVDASHLVLRHRRLFREVVERFPLHGVVIAVAEPNDVFDSDVQPPRLVLVSGARTLSYRWTGSLDALRWVNEQIELARQRAVAPTDPPAPPAELGRLRRLAQSGQSPANTTSGSSHTPV